MCTLCRLMLLQTKGHVAQLEMYRNGEQWRNHTRIHLHVHLLLQLKDRFLSIHSCSTSYKWSEKYVKRLLDGNNILPTQCTDFDLHITKHSIGSEHVYCTQYPMQYPQFFRCSFQLLQSIFQRKLYVLLQKYFFLECFFFLFGSFVHLFYFLLQFLWISSHQIINR